LVRAITVASAELILGCIVGFGVVGLGATVAGAEVRGFAAGFDDWDFAGFGFDEGFGFGVGFAEEDAEGSAAFGVRVEGEGFTAAGVRLSFFDDPAARAGSDGADRPLAVAEGATDGFFSFAPGTLGIPPIPVVGVGEACTLGEDSEVVSAVMEYPPPKPRAETRVSVVMNFRRNVQGRCRVPISVPPFDVEKPPPKWGF
jgi:hypothetical protein